MLQTYKQGGIFKKDGVLVRIANKQEHPAYVVDYHINICKKPVKDLPTLPKFGSIVSYTFADKTRDNFMKLLNDALVRRHWTLPIKTESQKKSELQNLGKKEGANYSSGIMGYMQAKEDSTKFNQETITGAFVDLDSLQEKSRQMVVIAEKIKGALARKELDGDSEEMREI